MRCSLVRHLIRGDTVPPRAAPLSTQDDPLHIHGSGTCAPNRRGRLETARDQSSRPFDAKGARQQAQGPITLLYQGTKDSSIGDTLHSIP
jgi:hypothetical protein